MFLDRLALAGITWTARAALSLGRTRKRKTEPDATTDLVETQVVVAPDRELLDALNVEQSMGYQGGRR